MAQKQPRWAGAISNRIRDTETTPAASSRGRPSYPSISSIPQTSASRLSAPDAHPAVFPASPVPSSAVASASQPRTILYLAYGSNLCAETFLGVRGIRPLSQINVSAPSLRLVFDLPGVPYREPCFANVAPRKLPKLPGQPKLPPELPDVPPPPTTATTTATKDADKQSEHPTAMPGDPTWSAGLIGVVYEVTPEDWARIVATEGGGASYADLLVPCFPIPPRMSVPEKPPFPELPKPFLAHVLCAPSIPSSSPPGNEDGSGEGGDGDGRQEDLPRWLAQLLLPVRRKEDYAQPSARYLKLIRDGAREHELPDDYQAYLARLRPYTITRPSQRVGMVLFLGLFAPVFLLFRIVGGLLADESGRSPRWVAMVLSVYFHLIWFAYDGVFRPVFGDGERTMEDDDRVIDQEKQGLLDSM